MLSNLTSGLGLHNQPILKLWLSMILKDVKAWLLWNYSSFIKQTTVRVNYVFVHCSIHLGLISEQNR